MKEASITLENTSDSENGEFLCRDEFVIVIECDDSKPAYYELILTDYGADADRQYKVETNLEFNVIPQILGGLSDALIENDWDHYDELFHEVLRVIVQLDTVNLDKLSDSEIRDEYKERELDGDEGVEKLVDDLHDEIVHKDREPMEALIPIFREHNLRVAGI